MILWRVPRGTPYDGLYGKAPPEKGYPSPTPPPPVKSSLQNLRHYSYLTPVIWIIELSLCQSFFLVFGWDMRIFWRKSVVDDVVSVCFFFSGTVIYEQSKCPTNVSIRIQFCLVDISVSSLWIVSCKHQQKQEKCINIYFVECENRELWVLASVYRFPLSLCLERRVVGHAISLSELEVRRVLCL